MRNFLIALSLLAGTTLVPALASAQANSSSTCVNLTYDMSIGSRDAYLSGEVSVLQKFLGTRPTTVSPYLTTNSFGFFGTQTEAAVRKFQEDNGLPAVGALGPLTRAKIKELTCGGGSGTSDFSASPTSGTAPLAVSFTFQANQTQTSYAVDFGDGQTSTSVTPCPQAGACSGGLANSSHTYVSSGTYNARLINGSNQSLGTTTITVAQSSTTTAAASLTFNGTASSQDVDPLVNGIWSWTSANSNIITATAVITGCKDPANNAIINPWMPWAVGNATGTSASGSISEIPGAARSGCTINATYSATNSTTGAQANAAAVVRFKTLLPGDIPPNPGAQCVNLQSDLTLNSTDSQSNGEVSKLQAFLQSTKSKSGSAYLTGEPTGYFGQLTRAAVIQFQTDNNLLAAGFVGTITRAKIKELTCAGTGATGITLTAPNGGDQWEEGSTNSVTWTPYDPNAGVNPAKDVTAYLETCYSGSGGVTDATCSTYGKVQESGKASIHWVTGELDSVTQGGRFAPPGGGYYIRIVNNLTGASDRSDSPFTLLQRPIILMVNGTEDWVSIADVNQPITLSWTTASGVSTCQLSGIKEIPSSTIQPNNGSVSGHIAYESVAGGISYGVSLQCVRSVNNTPTQITAYAKFSVASIPQIPVVLQVTSPNGGEQTQLGQPYTIRLTHSGLTSVSIALYKNDQWMQWLTKDSSPPDTLNWTPTISDIAAGDRGKNIFKIYVTGQRADGQGYVDDKSDAPFSIVTGSTNPNGVCIDLQNDLAYRATDATTNGEVSLLQDFFQSAISPSTGAPYLSGEPTGFFGQLTRAAVVQFQIDNSLPMVGTVGPATRAKIKALSCGGTSSANFVASPASGSAPLAVNFSVGGPREIDFTQKSYIIEFGDGSSGGVQIVAQVLCIEGSTTCNPNRYGAYHTYTSVGIYTAKLVRPMHDECVGALCTIMAEQVFGTVTITVTGTDTPPTTAECTILTHDLSLRSADSATGGDVSLLQLFLQSVTSPSTGVAYLTSEPTGFFGQLTKAGVMQYQTDNGITSTGVVGPITRAKIKDMSCGGTVPPPANAPIVSLTASPETVICSGSACNNTSAALGWNVKNASMCVATGGVGWSGYAPNGSWKDTLAANGGNSAGDRSVSPATTTTYRLECTNNSSNVPVDATATITVGATPAECNVDTEMQSCANGAYAARIGPNCTWAACPYNPNPASQAPTINSFTAASTTLSSGGSTNLSWSTTPSDGICWLSTNGGNGTSVQTSSSNYSTGVLKVHTKYTLSCYPYGKPTATPSTKDVVITIATRELTCISQQQPQYVYGYGKIDGDAKSWIRLQGNCSYFTGYSVFDTGWVQGTKLEKSGNCPVGFGSQVRATANLGENGLEVHSWYGGGYHGSCLIDLNGKTSSPPDPTPAPEPQSDGGSIGAGSQDG